VRGGQQKKIGYKVGKLKKPASAHTRKEGGDFASLSLSPSLPPRARQSKRHRPTHKLLEETRKKGRKKKGKKEGGRTRK
jgi:hypothetical protein